MTDDELQQKLRALRAPSPDGMARERARHRALIALSQPDAAVEPEPRRVALTWALMGLAVAALALAAALFRPQPAAPAGRPGQVALLTQVQQLFPGELDAVIERDGEVQVALASEERPASDQPLLVEFRRGDAVVRVFSFSGRHVCVDLGGRSACFDALIGEHGEVIVAGEEFVWTPQDQAAAGGWQITARALGKAS